MRWMEELISNFTGFIAQRYRQNGRVNVFDETRRDAFARVPVPWVRFIEENGSRVSGALEDEEVRGVLIELMAERTLRAIGSYNQFAEISPRERGRLRALYGELAASMRCLTNGSGNAGGLESRLSEALRRHFSALRSFMGSVRDADLLRAGGPVPCAEYGPAFQLERLGVSPEVLGEPVLDLGCGRSGLLVRFLRGLGIEAFGADRFAGPSRFLIKTDWLTASFGDGRWGTVLAHMSFSNHFTHHHLRRDGRFEEYARAYVRLLLSLKPGGALIYAPGMPFIECSLPRDRFEVTRSGFAAPASFAREFEVFDTAALPTPCPTRVELLA